MGSKVKLTNPQRKLLELMAHTSYRRWTQPGFLTRKMWPEDEYPDAWRCSRQGVRGQFLPAKIGSMLWRLKEKGLVHYWRRRFENKDGYCHSGGWYITDEGLEAIGRVRRQPGSRPWLR